MHFLKLLHITLFLIKKTSQNRYTRKQTRHFSMTPSRPKKFPKKPPTAQFRMSKKMTPKSQAKTKPLFLQYPFLTIF